MTLIRKLTNNSLCQELASAKKAIAINVLHLKLAITGIIPRLVNREESVNPTCFTLEEGKRSIGYAMTYTPQHIANFFLEKADAAGVPLTQLKLLKLVYIAYGWHLALKNKRLFDEPIEAWQHGPVVPSIYHEFKHFGKQPITSRSFDADMEGDDLCLTIPEVPESDASTRFVLDKVWAAYRKFSGWDLRNKTHEEGSPWEKVFRDGERGIIMNDSDIREHYIHRIRRYLEQAA